MKRWGMQASGSRVVVGWTGGAWGNGGTYGG